eukprot:TRINITY_DN89674_c0_g1_i1.p1 TRINITY_DN89674_c0_g1~~TRINITY_DN89674_c0_g1_i1.p1  ORF type:complete len:969 (-),score=185.79 TRINITY_DN89674_c0_g1_i1:523-3429(-)
MTTSQFQAKHLITSQSDSALLSRRRVNLDHVATSKSKDQYLQHSSSRLQDKNGTSTILRQGAGHSLKERNRRLSSLTRLELDGSPPSPLDQKSFELCVKSLPSMSKLPKMVASRMSSDRKYTQWRAGLQRAMLVHASFRERVTAECDATSQGQPLEKEPAMHEEHVAVLQQEAVLGPPARSESASKATTKQSRLSIVAAAAVDKADWDPPPNPIDGLPSAKSCLERYYQAAPILVLPEETERMKRSFTVFKAKRQAEVSTEYLPMILDILGFYVGDLGDEPILRYNTFSFDDFCDAVNERIVPAERELLKKTISEWNTAGKKREKALQEYMQMIGAPCTYASVESTMAFGSLYNARLNTVPDCSKEVLRFLACRRSCEGFTQEEMTELQEAFAECEGHDNNHIPATELSNALLTFAGLHCVDLLKELMKGVMLEGAQPVSFGEFVAFARILRTRQMRGIKEHMRAEDANRDGFISVSELRSMMVRVGFRLTDLEFKERLEESFPDGVQASGADFNSGCDTDSDEESSDALARSDGLVDFDAVWSFVRDCWSCNGFAKQEHASLTEIFERFCDESGEMSIVPVHNLLSYMGHENALEKTQSLAQMVDYNGNGTMDVDEFLTLMRLQKEENLKTYLAAYESEELSAFHPDLLQKVLAALDACNLLGLPEDTLGQMLESVREEAQDAISGLSFDSFVRLGEMCREIVPKQKRKRAFFSIAEEEDLLTLFDSYATCGNDHLTRSEFFALTSGVPELASASAVQRNRLLSALGKARENAKEAGIEEDELGPPDCNTIHFIPFIYLIRSFLDKHDQKINQKLGTVLIETGFSIAEVSEFRMIFSSLVNATAAKPTTGREKGRSEAESKKRTRAGAGAQQRTLTPVRENSTQDEASVEEKPIAPVIKSLATQMAKFTHVPCVAADVISAFVRSQTKLSGKDLGKYIVSIGCPAGIDFPAFLSLMCWVAKNSSSTC